MSTCSHSLEHQETVFISSTDNKDYDTRIRCSFQSHMFTEVNTKQVTEVCREIHAAWLKYTDKETPLSMKNLIFFLEREKKIMTKRPIYSPTDKANVTSMKDKSIPAPFYFHPRQTEHLGTCVTHFSEFPSMGDWSEKQAGNISTFQKHKIYSF